MIRTLLIDNHDSFTWNLVHDLIRVNGAEPIVVPNDWGEWESQAEDLLERIDNVVISPGPGTPTNPADVGICPKVIAAAVARQIPVLGICLGHQLIAHLFGATVRPSREPVHGRSSQITHTGRDIFHGVPTPFEAVRYHSLEVADVPPTISVDAHSDDGTVMALSVPGKLLWGVQFHPESVKTAHGPEILANFADLTRKHGRIRRVRNKVVPLGEVDTRALSEALFRTTFQADSPENSSDSSAVWLDGNAIGDPRARFSVMGAAHGKHAGPSAAVATADVAEGTVTVVRGEESHTVQRNILDWLQADLDRWNIRGGGLDDDLAGQTPFSFRLGWIGYLGYGVKKQCCSGEGGPNRHPASEPDAAFVFLDRAVVFDHEQKEAHLLVLDRPREHGASPWAIAESTAWVETTAATIRALCVTQSAQHTEQRDESKGEHSGVATAPGVAVSASLQSHDRASYTAKVRKIHDLIRAGETYEACLTTTLDVASKATPLDLYSALRRNNPAPFGAYLQLPGVTVMSTSPERFLRVDADGVVTSSPIKGTRPRKSTEIEDLKIRAELQNSEKDRAENLMIVDLVRHDLGRVAAPGTVQVPELFSVESYATAHQLVSTVRATLDDGYTGVDAVRAAFPPGSMTGAPKERTVRLLEELEDSARGVYSGALGYFSLNGAIDLSVVIRTLVASGERLTYGVGGAVVAQSDPDAEYDETVVKAGPVQQLGSGA